MQDKMWRDDIPQSTSPWTFLKFVTRPYRATAFFAILLVVLAGTADIGMAYIFKVITNSAQMLAKGGAVAPLWYATGAYICVSILSNLFWRGSGFVGMHWSVNVRGLTRYALSSYVTKHSHTYFAERFAGSVSSKISQAAKGMKDIVDALMWDFTPFIISVIGSFVLAFYTSPLIALVFLAWVFIVTPVNIYLVRKGVPLSVATQRAETMLGGATVDILTNMSAVHEYAQHSFELNRLKAFIADRRLTGLVNWKFREWIRLANGIVQIIFIGGMISIATYLTGEGIISAGDLVLVLTIILLIGDRLTHIGSQLNNFGDSWGQVTESLTDIVRPHEIPDAARARVLTGVEGAIALDNVTFAYGGNTIFDHLSIQIPAGQRVGLVGRSGAGKSTLIKLFLRHYEPTNGTITIDGNDISHLTKDSVRKAIAIVPQEPLLFHRTIRENISYGNPDATEEDIIHAAMLAEAHDFIMRLEKGYDSLVGERGIKLSGGQRQRIAIARALFKNAPILLLDEATSSLDSESEVSVQKALLNLMEHRTVIAIAHRLSTLRAMDRIIVMDEGRIVEDGTHAELIEKNGLYASLWNHQAGGFLED